MSERLCQKHISTYTYLRSLFTCFKLLLQLPELSSFVVYGSGTLIQFLLNDQEAGWVARAADPENNEKSTEQT